MIKALSVSDICGSVPIALENWHIIASNDYCVLLHSWPRLKCAANLIDHRHDRLKPKSLAFDKARSALNRHGQPGPSYTAKIVSSIAYALKTLVFLRFSHNARRPDCLPLSQQLRHAYVLEGPKTFHQK